MSVKFACESRICRNTHSHFILATVDRQYIPKILKVSSASIPIGEPPWNPGADIEHLLISHFRIPATMRDRCSRWYCVHDHAFNHHLSRPSDWLTGKYPDRRSPSDCYPHRAFRLGYIHCVDRKASLEYQLYCPLICFWGNRYLKSLRLHRSHGHQLLQPMNVKSMTEEIDYRIRTLLSKASMASIPNVPVCHNIHVLASYSLASSGLDMTLQARILSSTTHSL